MPVYEYQCEKCKEVMEVLQKVSDEPLTECEKCGGKAQQSSGKLKSLRYQCKQKARTPYFYRNIMQLERGQRPC